MIATEGMTNTPYISNHSFRSRMELKLGGVNFGEKRSVEDFRGGEQIDMETLA